MAYRHDAYVTVQAVQTQYEICRRHNRILDTLTHGGMPAYALDLKVQFVGRGHELARTETYLPHLEVGIDMLADNGRNIIALERFLGQHERRPARVLLLGGLEQPEERALEIGIGLQTRQYPVQHGRMAVVTAGVHDTLVLRGPLHTRHLAYRQRVDIGTQHHTPLRIAAASFDACQHARRGYRTVFDILLRQLRRDEGRRAVLLEREFGMAVQSATKIYGIHILRL